jgi:diguanylate cyclase (GGDEF)-like protein/PAS domain S-box-containing protein
LRSIRRTGYRLHELIGHKPGDVLQGPNTDRNTIAMLRSAMRQQRAVRVEILNYDRGGREYWVDMEIQSVTSNQGAVIGFIAIQTDTTERVIAARAAREANDRLAKIAANVPGALVQLRLDADGRIAVPYASEGLDAILGVSATDCQRDPHMVCDAIHPDDVVSACAALGESAANLTLLQHACRVRRKDDRELWIELRAMPQRQADGAVVWHGFLADITEKRLADDHLDYLANHDVLTNLRNRANITALIERAVVAARGRTAASVAVLLIDLNGFKTINDTYGHDVGDQVLIELARRLQQTLRQSDKIGRLGGDEIVVLVQDHCDTPSLQAIEKKIHDCVERAFVIGAHLLNVTCSIGRAQMPLDGTSTAALLKRADVTMYAAKAARAASLIGELTTRGVDHDQGEHRRNRS